MRNVSTTRTVRTPVMTSGHVYSNQRFDDDCEIGFELLSCLCNRYVSDSICCCVVTGTGEFATQEFKW